jgi:hypothetical protein
VWNAVAYALLDEGPKIGSLGVTQTSIFGAEVGVIGLVLNCIFAAALLVVHTAIAAKCQGLAQTGQLDTRRSAAPRIPHRRRATGAALRGRGLIIGFYGVAMGLARRN